MKVACLALVLLGTVSCTDRAEPSQIAPVANTNQPEGSLSAGRPVEKGGESTAVTSVAFKGGEVLASAHSSLLALSGEEANWLARHGYPTAEELDALRTYDLAALENAMRNRRDSKSAVLVGHLRALQGDIDGAASAFAFGADLGSLYARQQLAIAGTQKVTGLPVGALAEADQGNLGVLISHLEVARMLGDHRAQALIDRFAVNFDWKASGKHVLTQTAIFMDQYGEYARATGARAVGPDPRPNAELWAQLQEDPDALVKVYTRGRPYP